MSASVLERAQIARFLIAAVTAILHVDDNLDPKSLCDFDRFVLAHVVYEDDLVDDSGGKCPRRCVQSFLPRCTPASRRRRVARWGYWVQSSSLIYAPTTHRVLELCDLYAWNSEVRAGRFDRERAICQTNFTASLDQAVRLLCDCAFQFQRRANRHGLFEAHLQFRGHTPQVARNRRAPDDLVEHRR